MDYLKPFDSLSAKVPALGRGGRVLTTLVLAVLLLASGCAHKVNMGPDGRYHSAREMAAIRKKAREERRIARGVEKARQARARDNARRYAAGQRKGNSRNYPPSQYVSPDQATPELIRVARTYTGTPYRGGGTTRLGMDCSGLLSTTFQEVGLDIPRTSNDQASSGPDVALADVRPGDLVFFATDGGGSRRISHVGMVTEIRKPREDVQFIHSSSSLGVKEDNLYWKYWQNTYVKAVRPRLVPRNTLIASPASPTNTPTSASPPGPSLPGLPGLPAIINEVLKP